METENKKLGIGKLFYEINRLLMQNMRKTFEEAGITMPQGMVIGTLMKSGKMKMTDLSSKINLSNSTISGIIDRLEKQQLVERERSEDDRRIVYVKVVPKFDEMHKDFHKKSEERFENILSTATQEEIEKITEGLNVLKKILAMGNE